MKNENNFCLIMAGGAGTRFWPLSTAKKPKQYLDILGSGKTLIQETFSRLTQVAPQENIFVVTNAQYQEITKESLPQIDRHQIITEPCAMNTAPCILYSLLKIHLINPNANLLITPSDHHIEDEQEFVRIAKQALEFSSQNHAVVTLGIEPTRPDTGYGYIAFDAKQTDSVKKVMKFEEKPELEKAKAFVASGNYLWNAGIFVSQTESLLRLYKTYLAEMHALFTQDLGVYKDPDREADFINKIYPHAESLSIDYGIIEKAENVFVIPSALGWSDLGTWQSVYDQKNKDANANAVDVEKLLLQKASNNYIKVENHKKIVVVSGLENYIVIDTENALLICPMQENQNIKNTVKELEEKGFLEKI